MDKTGIWANVHEVSPGEMAGCMSSENDPEIKPASSMTCGDPQRPCYPLDAENIPGDYVLRGDGWWCPHP